TEFIHDVEKADDGSIVVDKYLCAGDNIYAAGDIARFPDWRTGQSVRIEHWRTAQQQGKCAALNMAGRKTRYRNIPFFWTNQSGNQLRYVGHAGSWDDMYVSGNISSGNFVAYYVKDGVILAAAGLNRDKEMLAIEELMKNEKMPDIAAVKKKLFDILSFIN
ncbi:MAG: NAD(FAD)-dependent dehydrogenase, partial [Candidatus Latescibacteria bacterium]|nr:NAD(FAD)-dependent dehydrogenase [Candidatus Latescibacterota bacterium]